MSSKPENLLIYLKENSRRVEKCCIDTQLGGITKHTFCEKFPKDTPQSFVAPLTSFSAVLEANDTTPIVKYTSMVVKGHDQTLCLPGKPSSMCVSKSSQLLAVISCGKLYVWSLPTGELLMMINITYTNVSQMAFFYDEDYLGVVSGTGQLRAYSLRGSCSDKHIVYNLHSAPITDILLPERPHSYIISCAKDKMIKIHCFYTQRLMNSFSCDEVPLKLAFSYLDLFVGMESGMVHYIRLSMPKTSGNVPEDYVSFGSHTAHITALFLSNDDCHLYSVGSTDRQVKVWHIYSRQCVKNIELMGDISCAVHFPLDFKMLQEGGTRKPRLVVPILKRTLQIGSEAQSVSRAIAKREEAVRKAKEKMEQAQVDDIMKLIAKDRKDQERRMRKREKTTSCVDFEGIVNRFGRSAIYESCANAELNSP